MFVKLQLDSNGFYILCSQKTSPPTVNVLGSPPEKFVPISKPSDCSVLESFSGRKLRRLRLANKQSHLRRILVHEPALEKQIFEKNPDGERRKNKIVDVEVEDDCSIGVKFNGCNGHGLAEKVHAKCSTKWICYGGSIPAILQALERSKDIDQALRPWAEKLSNKERTIILKEQSSWERAVEIFEWFKRKDCYELNVIHYNIMLRILGRARKWKYVQRVWNEMTDKGVIPINSTYGTLIDVYSKGGLKEQALCWLGRMNKEGMKPDEVTMGIVIQMYKMAGEFQKAEEFFKRWSSCELLNHEGASSTVNNCTESLVCLSCHTYNTLIDTYGKAGQLKQASQTFYRMLREGIVPTVVTFNTMIHICGNHGQLEEVASLMTKMEEIQCRPDTRTYNILISLHAKHDNIKMAASYFVEMKQAGLEPDVVSYRTLLYAFSIRHMVEEAEGLVNEMDERGLEIDEYTQSALTRMYIEAGMLKKSWLWFWRFHLTGNMSSDGYSANIDAYGERGYVMEAEKAFICCQESKKLTVLEFNVMIKAYGIGKNYEKACQLFDSMQSFGVTPDKCSYNSLVQILASVDMPCRARVYLRKMQDTGIISDCIPYCAVISSFVKLGQLKEAEELHREMIERNVKPDIVVYGVLINAFAEIGSVKETTSYVDAMKSAGLAGNAVIYNSLIKLYTKVGYLKEAQETYRILQSMEIHPEVYSSNCMIDLYSRRSMVREAEGIFENLKRKGDANEFTFAMMLCMYKRNGRFEEASHIAKEMREGGVLSDLLSYNNVLGLYALDGRFKEAVETFKEMMDATIQPDDYTFKSLGSVLIKCGVPKNAVNKLEALRKMDGWRGLQAWMSTLSSIVGIDGEL